MLIVHVGYRTRDQEGVQEAGDHSSPWYVCLLFLMILLTWKDKNPDDPTAHERFQQIGEAYQILSNTDLRKAYDKYGKDHAQPQEGFADPAEFFGTIFGGEAFVDLIGEISLMKDLTKTTDITMQEGKVESRRANQTTSVIEIIENTRFEDEEPDDEQSAAKAHSGFRLSA